MLDFIARALGETEFFFGQVFVRKDKGGFVLCHRADLNRQDLRPLSSVDAASDLARFDDAGNFRPLRTAPNLRRGWQLKIPDIEGVYRALEALYPGRLGVFGAWKQDRLQLTPLRETLGRQSGMYRMAAKISDTQIDDVVAGFCRSDGSCLRTILWKRDAAGTSPSPKLPREKFDPGRDQAGFGDESGRVPIIPLLCQEACNLLVAECRKAVKAE